MILQNLYSVIENYIRPKVCYRSLTMIRMPPQQPPYILRAEDTLPTVRRHINAYSELVDRLIQDVSPSTATFETVVLPLLGLENEQAGERAVIDGLKYFAPHLECQQAAEEAQRLWHESAADKRPELYPLLRAAREDSASLDPEQRKVIEQLLLSFEEAGFGVLDQDEMAARKAREQRAEQIANKFLRNLRADAGAEWFTLEELEGVPKHMLVFDGCEKDGKLLVAYAQNYYPIMKNAQNPETRRRMYNLHCERFKDNIPLFRETLLLRQESARELGHRSHAVARLPRRIAPSTEWVDELLANLVQSFLLQAEGKPPNDSKFDQAQELKRVDALNNDLGSPLLQPWDKSYYYAKIAPQNGSAKESTLSEYFPLMHTFNSILDLFAQSLQLSFEPLTADLLQKCVWSEDVRGWSVWDKRPGLAGNFIGYLFADLLSRPFKYKGNQSVNIQPVSSSQTKRGAPAILIIMHRASYGRTESRYTRQMC